MHIAQRASEHIANVEKKKKQTHVAVGKEFSFEWLNVYLHVLKMIAEFTRKKKQWLENVSNANGKCAAHNDEKQINILINTTLNFNLIARHAYSKCILNRLQV